jgi:hypothetical protein
MEQALHCHVDIIRNTVAIVVRKWDGVGTYTREMHAETSIRVLDKFVKARRAIGLKTWRLPGLYRKSMVRSFVKTTACGQIVRRFCVEAP